MIRPIMRSIEFLKEKSVEAGPDDAEIVRDLEDTIKAHRHECVGMAANMIGVKKRIIIFEDGGRYTVMLNPEIIKAEGAYQATEGCLSLVGERTAERYKSIKVRYFTENMQMRMKTYKDRTAQIIQHEMDHLEGIII